MKFKEQVTVYILVAQWINGLQQRLDTIMFQWLSWFSGLTAQ